MFKSFNKIIKVLILSDVFFLSAWEMVLPLLALFVVQNITGGDAGAGAKVMGIAIGTYWIFRSILQIPIGKYLDKIDGEQDDFYFMVVGTFLTGVVPLGLIFAGQPWHVYGLQTLHALGAAMLLPPWGGIFTRHIDKKKEATTWGAYSTLSGFGLGIAGVASGFTVNRFGFTPVFAMASALIFFSAILFILIKKDIIKKNGLYPITDPERV